MAITSPKGSPPSPKSFANIKAPQPTGKMVGGPAPKVQPVIDPPDAPIKSVQPVIDTPEPLPSVTGVKPTPTPTTTPVVHRKSDTRTTWGSLKRYSGRHPFRTIGIITLAPMGIYTAFNIVKEGGVLAGIKESFDEGSFMYQFFDFLDKIKWVLFVGIILGVLWFVYRMLQPKVQALRRRA